MKIKDNRRLCDSFENLKSGDVFTLDDNCIRMKIEPTYGSDSGDYENAVGLLNGVLFYFEEDKIVYPLNCELVIE